MQSLAERLIAVGLSRAPDFVIGGAQRPYLRRWWLMPRNPLANAYLHEFLRSDDDRAEHDHPWASVSILLRNRYREWICGVPHDRHAGQVIVRPSGRQQHRIELTHGPCWTLFLTGPRYRQWGFHCQQGWVHWRDFTAASDTGAVGKGCDQ